MNLEVRPGLDLSVTILGEGPPVVLLHGLAGFQELWSDTAAALGESGFKAITYDQRGHGHSGSLPPPWSISDLAVDLHRVLDLLALERVCLVGHSMGGRCLFQFALTWPDRIWALAPVGAHSEAPRTPYHEVLCGIRDITCREGLRGFRAAFERAGEIPERYRCDPEFARQFDDWFARNRPDSLVSALDAILTMPALTPRLSELHFPALAIVGERDLAFLESGACYERAMSGCRTVIVPGCHHYPMTDQPVFFNKTLLEFLRETKPDG